MRGIEWGGRRRGQGIEGRLRATARHPANRIRSNRRHDRARLRRLCREQEVSLIVMGWPLQLAGTEGEMAAEACRFAERIRVELGIPVELVDERLRTWEAGQTLTERPGGKSRSRDPTHSKPE